MIASTVWKNLVSTLENNPTLSGYIKYIFQGVRSDIGTDSLPCIMLEPVSNGEILREANNYKEVSMSLDLFAISSNNYNEFEKVIVGDENYRGILDIDNDIKECLQASYTLGDSVIDVQWDETLFDDAAGFISKYPVRGLMIPLRIRYRQFNGV